VTWNNLAKYSETQSIT